MTSSEPKGPSLHDNQVELWLSLICESTQNFAVDSRMTDTTGID